MKNRNGFTLIEVLMVTVIIGILASISLGSYTQYINKSRGAEARQILTTAYAGYRRLLAEEESVSSLSWDRMGLSNPNSIPNHYFTYTISPVFGPPTQLRATRGFMMMGCFGAVDQSFTLYLSNGSLKEVIS
jgi:prepilin-type N-terminal cleavage/methylation domain-containing protein